ncbi:MAG: hypothetical protein ACOCUH_03750, partial [Bacteriovoracia bacterium]
MTVENWEKIFAKHFKKITSKVNEAPLQGFGENLFADTAWSFLPQDKEEDKSFTTPSKSKPNDEQQKNEKKQVLDSLQNFVKSSPTKSLNFGRGEIKAKQETVSNASVEQKSGEEYISQISQCNLCGDEAINCRKQVIFPNVAQSENCQVLVVGDFPKS